MSHQSKLEKQAQIIEALTHVYLGLNSQYYTDAMQGNNIMTRNRSSQIDNICFEVRSLATQIFKEEATINSQFDARIKIFHNTAQIFGFSDIIVARASRAISRDSFRLCRTSNYMSNLFLPS